MKRLVKETDVGETRADWLYSRHFFSFGRYRNPNRFNFGKMIVFNDDVASGGKGFPPHPHDNAEIVSIVLSGKLAHKDSAGNEEVLDAWQIQRTSAGKGLWHSEYNGSETEDVHFLQIWFEPRTENAEPSYETLTPTIEKEKLNLVLSGSNQDTGYFDTDANIFIGEFAKEKTLSHSLVHGKAFLFVVSGFLEVNGLPLGAGEVIETDEALDISVKQDSRFVLIDLA